MNSVEFYFILWFMIERHLICFTIPAHNTPRVTGICYVQLATGDHSYYGGAPAVVTGLLGEVRLNHTFFILDINLLLKLEMQGHTRKKILVLGLNFTKFLGASPKPGGRNQEGSSIRRQDLNE